MMAAQAQGDRARALVDRGPSHQDPFAETGYLPETTGLQILHYGRKIFAESVL